MNDDLQNKISTMSDIQLIEMFDNSNEYTSEALSLVNLEINRRGGLEKLRNENEDEIFEQKSKTEKFKTDATNKKLYLISFIIAFIITFILLFLFDVIWESILPGFKGPEWFVHSCAMVVIGIFIFIWSKTLSLLSKKYKINSQSLNQ
jgi:pheromone shutdown protein TraB